MRKEHAEEIRLIQQSTNSSSEASTSTLNSKKCKNTPDTPHMHTTIKSTDSSPSFEFDVDSCLDSVSKNNHHGVPSSNSELNDRVLRAMMQGEYTFRTGKGVRGRNTACSDLNLLYSPTFEDSSSVHLLTAMLHSPATMSIFSPALSSSYGPSSAGSDKLSSPVFLFSPEQAQPNLTSNNLQVPRNT